MRSYRIGIEASPLGYPAGGGLWSFLHYAVRELSQLDDRHSYYLYTTAGTTPAMVPIPPADTARWHIRRAAGITAVRPTLWLQTGFRRVARGDRLDVLWVTRHIPPFTSLGIPLVATIFDVLYYRTPEAISRSLRLVNKLGLQATARRARRIIATSAATARDVADVLHVEPSRIDVAYGGVDHDRFFPQPPEVAREYVRKRLGLTRPYVLALEVFVARKNFAKQLEAYAQLPARLRREFPLVATGRRMRHALNVDVEDLIRRFSLTGQVHIVDHVDHRDMPMMYSAAALLAFASSYEGFGLPIVEAMACGCPVLTSDRYSMVEAGGDAALYASPDDSSALANQMRLVLDDDPVATDMRLRGFTHAKRFTWSAYAQAVLTALETAVDMR